MCGRALGPLPYRSRLALISCEDTSRRSSVDSAVRCPINSSADVTPTHFRKFVGMICTWIKVLAKVLSYLGRTVQPQCLLRRAADGVNCDLQAPEKNLTLSFNDRFLYLYRDHTGILTDHFQQEHDEFQR